MRTHHVAEGLPLAEYLEEEERIAQHVQEETFFTWVVAPTVIYGHHQILEQEVNVAYCREHNIDVVQRKSGGGCVYADRGNLMLSYVSPSTHSEEVFMDFLHRVANSLREMGYDAVTTEHNDILVSGHKIAGFACHALPTGTVVHACMLYEVNLDDLTQAITPTKEKLEKHAVSSVRQRVINLRDIKDSGSMEQFRRTLEKHILDAKMKTYLFTSESVSEGHPDKVADQISDAILDNFLAQDPMSRVACETLVTTGQVVIAGEVTSSRYVDVQSVARRTIARIGYTKAAYKFEADSCGIFTALHEQSADIARGVDVDGAGDQGMMFGYATTETDTYMPLTLDMAHTIVYTLASIRKEGKEMTYLRPDAKSQVTIEYGEDGTPLRIDTIVVSTQHDEGVSQDQIREDIRRILLPRVAKRDSRYTELLQGNYRLLVNPTGSFVIGGPHGDTGLTGRKIIVDTYGGRGAHGGGAFSGKDPSKVDRSAAYAARWIAKNMVAAGVAREMLVQISYAIGVAEPVSLFVNTYGTGIVPDEQIAKHIRELFDLTPAGIIARLNLRQPIYEETARYGHMGRTPEHVTKTFCDENGRTFSREVELFTWEKLDRVEDIKKVFNGEFIEAPL